jgi:hypothetical protein
VVAVGSVAASANYDLLVGDSGTKTHVSLESLTHHIVTTCRASTTKSMGLKGTSRTEEGCSSLVPPVSIAFSANVAHNIEALN